MSEELRTLGESVTKVHCHGLDLLEHTQSTTNSDTEDERELATIVSD